MKFMEKLPLYLVGLFICWLVCWLTFWSVSPYDKKEPNIPKEFSNISKEFDKLEEKSPLLTGNPEFQQNMTIFLLKKIVELQKEVKQLKNPTNIAWFDMTPEAKTNHLALGFSADGRVVWRTFLPPVAK